MLPVFTRPRGSMKASFSPDSTRYDRTTSARADALPLEWAPPIASPPFVPSPVDRPFVALAALTALAVAEFWAAAEGADLLKRFAQRVGASLGGGGAGRSSTCTGAAGTSPSGAVGSSGAASSLAGLLACLSSSDVAALTAFGPGELALGMTGSARIAGTCGRPELLPAFVGVTVDGVATWAGCAELGVVGDVDGAPSDGCSWRDGASEPVVSDSLAFGGGVFTAFGVSTDVALELATPASSIPAVTTASAWALSAFDSRAAAAARLLLLDFAAFAGNGTSGLESHGS